MAIKFLRLRDVQALRGEAKSTVYLRIKQGLFTKPVKLGDRASGWPDYECDALNAACIADKSAEAIRKLVQELHAARTQPLTDLDAARSAAKTAIINAGLLNAVDRTRVNAVIRLLGLEDA
jgi:prophage regulatory protein